MAFNGNHFTKTFGLQVPIVQGPMGGVAGPELVAAVADAGGLGMLPVWAETLESAGHRIDATRALTAGPFGVNLRADLMQVDHITTCLEKGVPIIHLFWGDPGPVMREVRRAGLADFKLMVTVGDADAARAALDAGADALIAQGVEAGGHVLSEMTLDSLLAAVLPLAGDVPVIAAGGLANAEDVSRVMSMGAAGALLGTRFAATIESRAHDGYK
ncbi:MAG: nitronate monooxygenase, partial [Pseudomonadales bacterium]|nr:nitronate monooxygenase [Pseudomonadales bacterium]